MNKALKLLIKFISKINFSSIYFLILAALIGGLAFAPFNQPIALFFSIYTLLSNLQMQPTFKNFFKNSAIFCFFFFLSHLYWVCWAVNVYGLPMAMPLVLIGMPLIIGIFPTICMVPSYYFKENKVKFAWILGAGWWISEIARSFLFTGFPWNLNGYIWNLSILQSTRFFGIFGLSLLTMSACVVLFTKQKRLSILALCSFLGLWIDGNIRLRSSQINTETNVRLVQPAIDQRQKWQSSFFEKNIERLEMLTTKKGEKTIHLTIWPEAAVTVPLDRYINLTEHLSGMISQGYLITGAPRITHNPDQVFSSLQAIAPNGLILATFDKFHLVPFGEYVPLRNLNPFPKLTQGTMDYSPGTGPKTITLQGIPPFSPLICYEAIFSGAVIDPLNRPQWLLNVTNDAWYGHTSGPYQHLKIVQVRAIEEGLPLIRVANNGISAVIDAYGRIIHQLELDKIGVIDASLPVSLPETLYRKLINFINFAVA
ncbi:MAG: apolipoprotein N-acyltransferase [Proteobacteria bacterium]|nr:apolipoprotein N-acyltransferase [Pseudomonadota bacterium]